MVGERVKGRLSDAMRRMLMRRATVVAREQVAVRFHLITLEGADLREVDWTVGQKVQIAMAMPFVTRTYTPLEWDALAGRTRILCYAHGDGPGSDWARNVKVGDACDLFGPRGSLDPRRVDGPLALFGDETSIGLAHTIERHLPLRSLVTHFEVGNISDAVTVTAHFGLKDAALFARFADETHAMEMEARLPTLVAANAAFVLAGGAQMIRRLRQSLQRLNVSGTRLITKAYWTPGKTGLD